MSIKKRSSVLPERTLELTKADSYYVISCVGNEFFCKTHEQGFCGRGFFSLFLQALYGIAFAKRWKIPYYINFGNLNYPYSEKDRFKGDKNFWDYYFKQPPVPSHFRPVYNELMESYPIRIWKRDVYQRLNDILVSEVQIRECLLAEIAGKTSEIEEKNTLGVHFRKSDYIHQAPYPGEQVYYKLVDRHLRNYDTLFLATDDEDVLKGFKDRYGDKLKYHPANRSTQEGIGIHETCFEKNGYEIGKQALIDCYSLAKCTKVILSPSNLSYTALVVNPNLDYIIAENATARVHRWKTNIAYQLNKWGIRKW